MQNELFQKSGLFVPFTQLLIKRNPGEIPEFDENANHRYVPTAVFNNSSFQGNNI